MLEFEHTWSRIEEAHERSGIGNLVRPGDLYLPPEEWRSKVSALPGAEVEHLEIARPEQSEAVAFHSQPTARFHGSIPAMLEDVQKQTADGNRLLIAAWLKSSPNTLFLSAWGAARAAAKAMLTRLRSLRVKS